MCTGTINQSLFKYPKGIRSMGFHLSRNALEWLCQSVSDNLGNRVSYHSLFNDLLSQMCLGNNTERGFYRPIDVCAGQTQISENLLVKHWHMGRKRIHRILLDMAALGLIYLDSDRTASVVTFTCVYDWVTDDGYRYENAYYRYRSLPNASGNS